jgi:hypothetical protein
MLDMRMPRIQSRLAWSDINPDYKRCLPVDARLPSGAGFFSQVIERLSGNRRDPAGREK